jgi:signal transduction histidine kinase
MSARTLQTRVLALAGAGVLGAAFLMTLVSRSSLSSLEQSIAEEHTRLATTIAATVGREVTDDLRLLSAAAATVEPEAQRSALSAVVRYGRLASAAFVVTREGEVLLCEPAANCSALPALARALVQRAIETQRPLVGGVEVPHGAVFGVMPFRSQDIPAPAAGGIRIAPGERRLADMLVAGADAHVQFAIVDADGRLVAGPASVLERVSASAEVPGTAWSLRVAADTEPVAATFRRRSVGLAIALSSLALLLAWGVSRSVRQPLLGLTRAAERIAGGNLLQPIDLQRAGRGGGEVRRLAVALERMRASLVTSMTVATANARLEERERVRQQLLRKLISAQEDERKRIARELHDETSQTLAALGMAVDLGRMDEARRLAERMHEELHRLIVDLRPSVLDDLGLAAAIQWFAERHLSARGIAVRCEIAELEGRLSPEVETALFRAVQEAIVNITRHAQADTVLIQLSADQAGVMVEIEDDGIGFDPTRITAEPGSLRGIGLLGMRERLEIVGGTLRLDSEPGGGTHVVMTVPVTPVAESLGSVTGSASSA